MITVQNIKLPVTYRKKDLTEYCEKILKCRSLPEVKILRRSLDARNREQIHYHISAAVTGFSPEEEKQIMRRVHNKNIMLTNERKYAFPVQNNDGPAEESRPVIIGTGPAGYFAGLMLARAGFRPILIERGKEVEQRKKDVEHFWETGILDTESNVSFGEGGAGTFSDGKLYTGNKDKDGAQKLVLDTFHRFGAPEEITYDAKPHIGTDVLYGIMQNMRKEITELGGEIHFSHQLCGIEEIEAGEKGHSQYKLTIKKLCKQDGEDDALIITTPAVIPAIGHSARDTFGMLGEFGLMMEQKPFAMGLRIEHPREMIDHLRYGNATDELHLPAADYKLTCHTSSGRAVFSFCMCPGGYVVNASTEKSGTVVNGMSYSGRSGKNSNSALVVNILPEDIPGDEPMDAVAFQRELEQRFHSLGDGRVPVQRWEDFCNDRASEGMVSVEPQIKGEYTPANLRKGLPEMLSHAIIEAVPVFAKELPGFDMPDAVLSGIESRTSSPVRMIRNDELQAVEHPGIFPCGEGAGYAGGIMSAAVDGIHVAEKTAGYLKMISEKRTDR